MPKARIPLPDRLWSKLQWQPNGCWYWTARVNNNYGSIRTKKDGKWGWTRAHRVAYELIKGPIPDGMEIDHLCGNRPCCHPYHLEAVTPEENRKRALILKPPPPTCPKGHIMDESNIYRFPGINARRCRKCMSLLGTKWKSEKRRKKREGIK